MTDKFDKCLDFTSHVKEVFLEFAKVRLGYSNDVLNNWERGLDNSILQECWESFIEGARLQSIGAFASPFYTLGEQNEK